MTTLITTREAADIIHCHPRHVVKLYHAGRLTGQYHPQLLLIDRASAEGYVTQDARAVARLIPIERADREKGKRR